MIIRKEQIAEFEQAAVTRFEDFMVPYLGEFYPEQSKRWGEPRVRAVVRQGVDQAETYGIVERRDVCLFIDLMFKLGPDFDRDGSLPEVQRILNDSVMPPGVKMTTVFDAYGD